MLEKVRDEEQEMVDQLKERKKVAESGLVEELQKVKEENLSLKEEIVNLRQQLAEYGEWMKKQTDVIEEMASILGEEI